MKKSRNYKVKDRNKRLNLSPGVRRWRYFLRWAEKMRLWVKLEITLAVLTFVVGIAAYAALSSRTAPVDLATGDVQGYMLGAVIVLLALGGLIARRVTMFWSAHRRGNARSRLQSRMVSFFIAVAIVPAIMMAIASTVFFEFGLQNWFSDTVQRALNSSLQVAESYVAEHRQVIQGDILAMSVDLNRRAAFVQSNNALLQTLVNEQVAQRALSEAIVFDSSGAILAQGSFGLSLAPQLRVSIDVVQRAQQGELVMISDQQDDRVQAVVKLVNFFDAYLYVSRAVDAEVLSHVEAARTTVEGYQNLEAERAILQFRFNAIFLTVALITLLVAVWVALWLANQLVAPIGALVQAAEKVGQGDLKVRVPAISTKDEIGTLSRAFNRMTHQIEQQQSELKNANIVMDERRRFTEAVLSGVSAGVIGFDYAGLVTLPNQSACELLGMAADDMEGTPIAEIIPEIAPILDELFEGEQDSIQGQVNIVKKGIVRTLLLRIAAETQGEAKTGYVMTFDDITEQLATQRTAAWADVARRIAHEIKNPLTPIQLSAERLWRKYQKEISTDPEVFKTCTDTIIRQVGDLKRMVDEFSSFARMPEPVFRIEDIVDVTRQALFLQEVAHPDIKFKLHAPDGKGELLCDGRLVAQAISNLIKNAGESISARVHTEDESADAVAGGQVDIHINAAKHYLEITIEDNGCGLPENLAKNIMEPYVTTREKGTGLGLAIVRKIMEDHGGTLTLENRNQPGVRVVLRFNHASLKKLGAAMKDNRKKNSAGRGGIAAE
jgi:two-component system, NtrC family, nitrogen regulation sensor histidine kinase NtrY